MVYVNLGCGNNRSRLPIWINVDDIYAQFPDVECNVRKNLALEPNYINMDVSKGLRFQSNSIDGVLASHVFEHFDLQESIILMRECKRILKPEGVLRVSSPCPHLMYDKVHGGLKDWGEYCPPGLNFMEYALFYIEHKQIIDWQILKCMFHFLKFKEYFQQSFKLSVIAGLGDLDNRQIFSIFAEGIKSKDDMDDEIDMV